MQTGDGWAAHVAGAIGVSTDAQASWWGGRGIGTIPHSLIAAHDGDTVAAARAFAQHFGTNTNVTVLVDFDNDSLRTAVAVADALGEELWGVRLDTSERLVDETLADLGDDAEPGVSVELARRVRAGLDDAGPRPRADRRVRRLRRRPHHRLRGGRARPVDAYGVGSSLLRGQNDFTADVVRVDGKPCAKVGREERPNPRLDRVR